MTSRRGHISVQTSDIFPIIKKWLYSEHDIFLRELVANALIHQDFFIGGTGPMVEVFADRMEITNPGAPLVEPERFLDTPPRSRNEILASMMRRVGVCEERGSGIDKVVLSPVMTESGIVTSKDLNRLVRTASRPIVTMTRQACAVA